MNTTERKEHLKVAKDYLTKVPAQHARLVLAIQEVISVIASYEEEIDDRTMEEKKFDVVTEMLNELGVPANLLGYDYIRSSIILVCFDRTIMASTNRLYSVTAEKYGSKPQNVERAIRYAIETAWDRGDSKVLKKYFGNTISPKTGKPTSSEFIATLAERVRRKLEIQL